MKLLKRLLRLAAGALAALALAILVYWWSGSSAVESWVGAQLLRIGGTYLQPELHFDRLTYERPRTIVLDNLTLTSPDSAKPGHSIVILSVKRARLQLTEIPQRGQPIKFSEVVLESPEVRLIAQTPGKPALIGFSHFLKGSGDEAPASAASASGTSPAPVPQPASPATAQTVQAAGETMKLSDWLLIRNIQITGGKVTYDPRLPDRPPLWLDGINVKLDFTPADANGNYALTTRMERKPAVSLDLEGRINIDTLDAQLGKLALAIDLREENNHYFPPELQKFLKEFEVAGQLNASASGSLAFRQWQKSSLKATADLTSASVAIGDHALAIDSWNWQADMSGGVLGLQKADARLLGGELRLGGTIPLQGDAAAKLTLNASGLKIQKLLRTLKPGEPPTYAGGVSADINFSAPLAAWDSKASGGGTFNIRDGRIAHLPLLEPVIGAVSKSLSKAIGVENNRLTDVADGSISFAGDGVRVDRLQATSGAMALRATGTVGFDGKLDMRLNAGPLERLQDSLGKVGEIWANVSDALAGYRLTGTVAQPRVTVEVGGK